MAAAAPPDSTIPLVIYSKISPSAAPREGRFGDLHEVLAPRVPRGTAGGDRILVKVVESALQRRRGGAENPVKRRGNRHGGRPGSGQTALLPEALYDSEGSRFGPVLAPLLRLGKRVGTCGRKRRQAADARDPTRAEVRAVLEDLLRKVAVPA